MTFCKKSFTIFPAAGIIVLAMLLFSSCKSTKKIQAAISKKDTTSVHITNQAELDSIATIRNVLTEIHGKRPEYKTFSAKIRAGPGAEPAGAAGPKLRLFFSAVKPVATQIGG